MNLKQDKFIKEIKDFKSPYFGNLFSKDGSLNGIGLEYFNFINHLLSKKPSVSDEEIKVKSEEYSVEHTGEGDFFYELRYAYQHGAKWALSLHPQVVQSEVSEKVSDNFKKAFPYFIDEMKNLLYIQEKDELNKSGKIRLNELLFVNDLIKSPTPPDAEKWISVDEKPKTEGYYKDKEIAELKLRAEKWSDRAIELQSTIESQQKEIEELKAQRIVDAECISQSGAYRIESIKQIASLESQLSEVTKERDMLEKTCTRAQDHAEYLLSDSHILTPKIKTNR